MADQTVVSLLRLAFDHEEAKRGLNDIQNFRSNLGQLRSDAEKTSRSLSNIFKGVHQSVNSSDFKALSDLRKSVGGASPTTGAGTGGGPGTLVRTVMLGNRAAQAARGLIGEGEFNPIKFSASLYQLRGAMLDASKSSDLFGAGLGKVAVAMPIVGGLALGLAGGLTVLAAMTKESNDALQGIIASQQDYFNLIATGTKEQVADRLKALENEKTVSQKIAAENKFILDETFRQLGEGLDKGGLLTKGAFEAAMKSQPALQAAQKAYDEYSAKVNENGIEIERLTGALKSNATAAADAAAANEKALNARIGALDEDMQKELAFAKLAKTATSEQIDSRVDEIELSKQQLRVKLAGLETEDQANQKVKDSIAATNKALDDLDKEEMRLLGSTKGLVKAREEETEKLEANKRIADSTKRFNEDIQRIDQDNLGKRADIEQQYHNKILDITKQARETAETNLRKLSETRADLTRTLGRDEAKAERAAALQAQDIQIQAQREEVQSLREHERELDQIRKDAAAQETGYLLDRNFKALYLSRLQTSRDLERSNEQFFSGREGREQATRDQLDDLRRQQAAERQERLIQYQQNLQDAQAAYIREQQLAEQARVAQINQAIQTRMDDLRAQQQKYLLERQIRSGAYDAELKLVSLYGEARIKQEKQIQDALLAQGNARLALMAGVSGASSSITYGARGPVRTASAGGNPLVAGQRSWVNELGGETWSSGGKTYALPGGIGVFTPANSGRVNPAGSNQAGAVTMNIYPSPGMDEERLAHKVLDQLERVLT